MDSPYGSVTPSSTHLGTFASNLSGGQMYGPGAPLGGAPTAANFNRQHFSPLSLLTPCSSASNGEYYVVYFQRRVHMVCVVKSFAFSQFGNF